MTSDVIILTVCHSDATLEAVGGKELECLRSLEGKHLLCRRRVGLKEVGAPAGLAGA